MNFDYKKYPVTAGVIGICILVIVIQPLNTVLK